jgi:hypothetical protein
MKGGDHGVQTARQMGNGLRTKRAEFQAGDDAAYLAVEMPRRKASRTSRVTSSARR